MNIIKLLVHFVKLFRDKIYKDDEMMATSRIANVTALLYSRFPADKRDAPSF